MLSLGFLATLAMLQGLAALRQGYRQLEYVRRELNAGFAPFTPRAAVIAPCKGIDYGFRENMEALLRQDYPDYQVVFVTETVDDPAHVVLTQLLGSYGEHRGRVVVAGKAHHRAQKLHNLLGALEQVPADVKALCFVDSDARVTRRWLKSIIAPLAGVGVGAVTGYRWYLPEPGSFPSLVRSLWNASIVTLLGGHGRNFAWGGSMAILRETFERADIRRRWQGAGSDDYALTHGVKALGKSVKFAPQCLVPSSGGCSWTDLLTFTTRQMVTTRVYSPHIWLLGLVTNVLFALALTSGLGTMVATALSEGPMLVPLLFTSLVYLPGILQAGIRLRAIGLCLPEHAGAILGYRWAYLFLYPLANLIFLWNFACSAFSRRVRWRGTIYELRSPSETVVVGIDSPTSEI